MKVSSFIFLAASGAGGQFPLTPYSECGLVQNAFDFGKDRLPAGTEANCKSVFGDPVITPGLEDREGVVARCSACKKAHEYYENCVEAAAPEYSGLIADQRALSFLSGLSLMAIGFFFLLNSKFSVHPFRFTAAACLAQSTQYFSHYQGMNTICSLKIPALLSGSLQVGRAILTFDFRGATKVLEGERTDLVREAVLYRTLLRSWILMNIVPIYLSLVLNCMLLLDLYLTLKNPFFPRKRRALGYYAATLCTFILTGLLVHLLTTEALEDDRVVPALFMAMTAGIMAAMLVLYVLIIARMVRKGTSSKLRKILIRRYIVYFFIYQLIAFAMLNDQSQAAGFKRGILGEVISSDASDKVLELFFSSTGIFLALVLLVEPFVFQEFKTEVKCALSKMCWCFKKKKEELKPSLDKFLVTPAQQQRRKEKTKYGNEPLSAFVNSAMNIELVYLILIGINNFMEEDSLASYGKQLSVRGKAQTSCLQIARGARETKITFSKLQFKDISKWNVDSKSELTRGESQFDHLLPSAPAFGGVPSTQQSELPPMRYASINDGQKSERSSDLTSSTVENKPRTGSEPKIELVQEDSSTRLLGKSEISALVPRGTRLGSVSRQNPARQYQIAKDGRVSILMDSHVPPRADETGLQDHAMDEFELKSEFIRYEEETFKEIMLMDGINPSDVMESLNMEDNRNMIFKAGESAGQSGSFFFFSHDSRFLIKTLLRGERQRLLSILDSYLDHLKKTKNRSLIARIYGVFTIKTNRFATMDVIIMQNTACLSDKANQKLTFDLKGSTVNRKVHVPKFWLEDLSSKKVLKDKNFLEISKDVGRSLLKLSPEQFSDLKAILAKDSAFLKNQGLMDYSLLLVIEQVKVDQSYLARKSRRISLVKSDASSYDPKNSFLPGLEQAQLSDMEAYQRYQPAERNKLSGGILKVNSGAYSFRVKSRSGISQSKHSSFLDLSMSRTNFYAPQQYEQVYHFGIIDFLQTWNFSKKAERAWKTLLKKGEFANNLSAVPPVHYQARFADFVNQSVLRPGLEQYRIEQQASSHPQRQFVRDLIKSVK